MPLVRRRASFSRGDWPFELKCDGLIYCDHVESDGHGLFNLACANDLEGIVAKREFDPYRPDHATWYKIRNTNYSQWVGREKLFERERKTEPDTAQWDQCAQACDVAGLESAFAEARENRPRKDQSVTQCTLPRMWTQHYTGKTTAY